MCLSNGVKTENNDRSRLFRIQEILLQETEQLLLFYHIHLGLLSLMFTEQQRLFKWKTIYLRFIS